MNKFERYRAEIAPKQRVIRIIRETFDSKNPRFKKKNLTREIVKTLPIEVEIPIEEFKTTVDHFDNKAFQTDDRFFSTIYTGTRYSVEVCKELCEKAMTGYNKEPVMLRSVM